jgi:GDP-L-fucose synthase
MIECSIVRPFNAYGLRDYYDEETSHVIPALIKKAFAIKLGRAKAPLVVWGSGNQTRVFTHTIDFARGIRMVTEKLADGTPCNVGDDNKIAIKDLAAMICGLVGIDPVLSFDKDMPEGYPERAADPTRLRTTGWNPAVKLVDGIEEMVQWCESHDGKF